MSVIYRWSQMASTAHTTFNIHIQLNAFHYNMEILLGWMCVEEDTIWLNENVKIIDIKYNVSYQAYSNMKNSTLDRLDVQVYGNNWSAYINLLQKFWNNKMLWASAVNRNTLSIIFKPDLISCYVFFVLFKIDSN